MNRLSRPTMQEAPESSAISDVDQELSEQVRAMRALGILLESKLIDDSEYQRRAAIFGAE